MQELLLRSQVILIFMWPTAVVAAQLEFSRSLSEMSVPDFLIALFISSLSGVTALLAQMKSDYETNGKIERLPLYAASKLSGSNLAGIALYAYAVSNDWDVGSQVIGIILAAFGGTWALQRIVTSIVTQKFPVPPVPPVPPVDQKP